MANSEAAGRLEEIRDEMLELIREAEKLVGGTDEYERARGYWLAHIKSALGSDNYPTHATTMQDSINALAERRVYIDGEMMECDECGEPAEYEMPDCCLCEECHDALVNQKGA